MKPKVSVIIPAYNRAEYIPGTLNSVFSQIYRDFEVIVINDGSTDNTTDVLKPYLDRIKYIYKSNGGPASARNIGIKVASGVYIAFLDSDDLWLPEKLKYQVEYLETHGDVGLVFSDTTAFGEGALPEDIARAEFRFGGQDPSFKLLVWGNFIPTLTVMLRRECLEPVGYFDESPDLRIGGEDYELWLRIARIFKLGHVNNVLAKYRLSPGSLLGIDSDKSLDVEVNVISRIFRLFPSIPKEIGVTRDQTLARICTKYAQVDLKAANFKRARKRFQKALAYQPFCSEAIKYYLLATYREKRSIFQTAIKNL